MPPPPQTPTPTLPQTHTYHCPCSTLLLATPYLISHLPRRSPPSLDRALILPLPAIRVDAEPPTTTIGPDPGEEEENKKEESEEEEKEPEQKHLPSLLMPGFRPVRKPIVVQRSDGWERRRVWRCGRCGVVGGYEIEGAGAGAGTGMGNEEGEKGGWKADLRVMYLLEEGLVETGEMGAG